MALAVMLNSSHFQREGLGEGDDAALAGRVIGLAKCAHLPDDRADIDDAPEPLIDHGRHRRAGAVKRAVQVDIDHRCPVVIGHLAHASIARDTGVVHQDVEALPFVEHFFDDARGLAFLGHVALNEQALDTQFADFVGGDFGLLGIRPEVQRHVRPAAREFKRDRPSYAARGPGHQCDLTGERSRLVISTSLCNVCHFLTPALQN